MKTSIALLFPLVALAGHAQAEQQVYSATEVEQSIDIAVAQINTKLPMMVDENTRLDRVTKDASNKTTHHFTFVSASAPALRDPKARDLLESQAVKLACENPGALRMMDSGMTATHTFTSNDGKPVFSYTITRDSCGPA